MSDNVALKVRQGGFLLAGEGSSEGARGLFSLLSVCVCAVFFPMFSCLTCCLFNQLPMPQPAFGTSLGLVKLAHFPLFPLLSLIHFSPISFATTSTVTVPCSHWRTIKNNTTPIVISNKLTKLLLSNAHIHTIHH